MSFEQDIIYTQLECGCTHAHNTVNDDVVIITARGTPNKANPKGPVMCSQTRVLPIDRIGRREAARQIKANLAKERWPL